MLFFILIVAAIVGIAVYVTKKTQTTNSTIPTTPPSTIHEEIAKTIEEAKNLAPIEEAPKMKAEPKKTSKPALSKAKDDSKSTKPQVKKAPKKK